MKTLKRMLASLMVAVMVLTAAPLSGFVGLELNLDWLSFDWLDFNTKASAESYNGTCGDNLTWSLDTSTGDLVISGTGDMSITSDYSPWYGYNSLINAIVIENGVTSIDHGAFANCTNITSVTIGNSVRSIGNSSFYGCTGLTSIIIPDSVTTISDYAFVGCTGLTDITIGSGITLIDYDVFRDCTNITDVYYTGDLEGWCAIKFSDSDSNPLYYADNLYFNGELVTDIVIHESITSIGSYAFYGYSNLKSVHYLGDESQVTIPDTAFEGTSATVHYCAVVGNPPATCTQAGEGSWHCAECNKDITDKIILPALGHDLSDWQVTTDSTCTETGIETRSCSRCDVTETRTVDVKGHDWSNKDGICVRENCGIVCEHPEESITWETVVEPTCVPGLEYGSCNICGIVGEKTIVCDKSTYPESPHNYSDNCNRIWGFSYSGADKLILEFSSSTQTENNYDYIYIYDGSGTQIGKYSGTQLSGAEIEVEGSRFQITLTSDSFSTYYGFKFDSITAVIEVSAIEREIPAIEEHDWSNKDGICANSCGTECLHESFTDGECDICGGTCSTLGHIYDADLEKCIVCGHTCTTMGHIFNSANTKCIVCDALTGTCGSSLTWLLERNGQLVISGTGVMYNYSSSSVAPWNNSEIPITSVVIGDGVTSIGNYAFNGCTGLTSVTIPDSVTSIGNYAFYNCSGLTELTMPISAKIYNSSYTFGGCTNIEKITLTKGNGTVQSYGTSTSSSASNTYYQYTPWYISGCSEIVIADGVTGIGSYTFCGCRELTSVTIPDSVTSIGSYAISGCTGLTGITIPDSVTSISSYTFSGCTGLTSVTIPDSVTSIGDYAFYNCSGITELTMPISAKIYNSSNTFYNCYNIEKITLTAGTGSAQSYETSSYYSNTCYQYTPWYISGCSEIVIADGVTGIGSCTFYNCTGLTNVTIGNGVANIGSYAFYGCTGLSSITIPDSVTRIGSSAWYSCSNADVYFTGDLADWCAITFESYSANPKNSVRNVYIDGELVAGELIIPDGVTSIGSHAFYNFTGITSVTIPTTVTNISNDAFSNCYGIEATYYPGAYAQWRNISIDSNNSDLTKHVIFDCNSDKPNYGSGTCGENIEWILHTDGELVITGTGAMVEDFNSTSMTTWRNVAYRATSVVIDDRITSIGAHAFAGCYNITSITIPDGVTSIGNYAFCDCDSLTEVTLPDGLTVIGEGVFGECHNLTSITIPDSVTSIGDLAFYECIGLTSIVIPDSVTSIGSEAFYYCLGLTTVTIGAGVKSIGDFSFAQCDNLEDVIFLGEDVISLGKYLFATYIEDEVQGYVGEIPGLMICCKENSWMHFYVDSNDKKYCLLDSNGNPAFEIQGDSLASYRGNVSDVILPSVSKVGYGAFENNSTIENIEIPDGVSRIYNNAFKNCSELKVVIIPQSVTSIGATAFNGCDNVTIWCYAGSYADDYAQSHDIDVEYITLSIDQNIIYIAPNEQTTITYSLNTHVAENMSVVWESTDKTVVTVDSFGNIKGIKAGTAVVVLTSKDGSMRDYCVVKVVGIEAMSTLNINFESGIISGLSSNTTSLDGLITMTDSSCNLNYTTLGTDSIVYVERGNEIVEAYTILIYGDVNGDGWYDGQDAVLVSCLANGMLTKDDVSEAVYTAADCNHDGVIDQLDVDLLNEAGTLLANVDQSKPTEVLLETSSEYVAYLDLIEQSFEIDKETEDIPEVDAEETSETDTGVEPEGTTPEQDEKIDIFEMIMNIIRSIFKMLFAHIPVPYK